MSLLSFSEPSVNNSGGLSVYMKYNNKLIYIKSPMSTLQTDLCKNGCVNKFLSLQFTDISFQSFLSDLDMYILKQAFVNNKKWFGKSIDEKTINSIYKRNTIDNFKLKIPLSTNKTFNGIIYDEHRNIIDQSYIKYGCSVQFILEITGLYFIGNEFGISWKTIQIKVKPNDTLTYYAFNDNSDDDISDAEPND